MNLDCEILYMSENVHKQECTQNINRNRIYLNDGLSYPEEKSRFLEGQT